MRTKDSHFSGSKAEPGCVLHPISELKSVLCDTKTVEEKIALFLLFMKKTLSEPSKPRFKDFWDAKYLCFSLFKQRMSTAKKSDLWSQYVELSGEARRLKGIFDEQTTFFVEQVEVAIQSMENDFTHFERIARQMLPLKLPKNIGKWIKRPGIYPVLQRELHVLAMLTSRFRALKEEVMGSDYVRISVKNRLLKRLTKFGNQVFPRRKELTEQISNTFIRDVDTFVEQRFVQTMPTSPSSLHVFRCEVQAFQALAKVLTLNRSAFAKTHSVLGRCWERIQKMQRDRKREHEEREKASQVSKERCISKIEAFEAFCSSIDDLSGEEVLSRASDLCGEIVRFPLRRDDVKQLHEKIESICTKALENMEERVKKREKKQSGEVAMLRQEIINTLDQKQHMDLEALCAIREKLMSSFRALRLSVVDKQKFERQFLHLSSTILDKKEAMFLSLDEWKELLKERRDLIGQIKKQVEDYRKEMGGSSLDFEKGMTYRGLHESAKIHLGEAVVAMDRLREKIAEKEL